MPKMIYNKNPASRASDASRTAQRGVATSSATINSSSTSSNRGPFLPKFYYVGSSATNHENVGDKDEHNTTTGKGEAGDNSSSSRKKTARQVSSTSKATDEHLTEPSSSKKGSTHTDETGASLFDLYTQQPFMNDEDFGILEKAVAVLGNPGMDWKERRKKLSALSKGLSMPARLETEKYIGMERLQGSTVDDMLNDPELLSTLGIDTFDPMIRKSVKNGAADAVYKLNSQGEREELLWSRQMELEACFEQLTVGDWQLRELLVKKLARLNASEDPTTAEAQIRMYELVQDKWSDAARRLIDLEREEYSEVRAEQALTEALSQFDMESEEDGQLDELTKAVSDLALNPSDGHDTSSTPEEKLS